MISRTLFDIYDVVNYILKIIKSRCFPEPVNGVSDIFRLGKFNRIYTGTHVDRGIYKGRAVAMFKISKQCASVDYEELRARVNTCLNVLIPNVATYIGIDHDDDFWYYRH
jgi:hypothetical protein